MSICYHISCRECRKTLWIGQDGGKNGWYLYTGDKKVINKLEKFMFEHEGHELFFSNDSSWSNDPKADKVNNYLEV